MYKVSVRARKVRAFKVYVCLLNTAFSRPDRMFEALYAVPMQEPSFELEIFFQGQWLEVLGCGVTQQQILDDTGHMGKTAWAFG